MKTKFNGILTLLLAFVVQFTFAQQKTISGTVSDESGPLPGVSVLVKGTRTGAETNFDGKYTIKAKAGDILVFRYLGYKTVEKKVGSSSSINVTLAEDSNMLDEVVITGFGNVSKTSFAGSAKVVAGQNISQKSFTNVSQALAGEAAGVNVINTSGQPGSVSTIRIRGFGSVNGSNAPLYIVDDAPFQGSLNDINPNDIKSVTILKDASATSLYGARGSNGVIVITTKRGKGTGSSINVSIKNGTNYQGIPRYETIGDPEEYIGIAWEGIYQRGLIVNNGDNALAIDYANRNLFEGNNDDVSDIPAIYNMWNTTDSGAVGVSELIDPTTGQVRPGVTRRYTPENWEDFAFQPSNRLEANVSMSNSFENSSIYVSLGFVDDVGYASNTDFRRLNARVAGINQIGENITINTSLNYAQSEQNDNGTGSSSSSQFWWIDNLPSIYPLYRRDAAGDRIPDPIYGGFLFDYGLEQGRGFGFATNGVADSQINISRNKNNSVNFNNDIKINLFDGLTLENNFAYQYFMNDDIDLNEPFYSPAKGNNGAINRTRRETKNYTLRTGLRYTKTFNDFKVNAFLSHVATNYEFNYLEAERTNLVTPFGIDLSNGVVNQPVDGFTDREKTESYIANVTTDYAGKYFFNATFNRDGTSRFRNNQWGNFYSFGAAWMISKEDFMSSSSDFINLLKLKASYGVIGNSGVLNGTVNRYYPGFNQYSINNLNNNISLAFNYKGNPDLTWESSNQFNVGLEFELGNFIDGSLEYYSINTTDMFFNRDVGPSLGSYASILVNDGEIVNRGFEFDLNFKVLQKENFKLDFGINGAMLTNEFKALPIDPATGLERELFINGQFAYQVGRSLYDRYIPVYAGVNPDTGAAQWEQSFVDTDGDGVFTSNVDERVLNLAQYQIDNPNAVISQGITEVYADATDKFINKTAIPDVSGAFRLNAEIGNFTIGTLFNYQIGGWAYDTAYANLMDNDFAGTNNFSVDIRDRWKAPGDITDIPRQDAGFQIQQNAVSTRFLTDASFLALNNVRIGYKLPSDVVSKIKAKNIELFVTGDNLWLLSKRKGFNPSTSVTGASNIYRYSPLSTVVIGVNLNL